VLGTQFDRVWLSNSWWRILKADMADPSNGNQALILKEQALTAQETGDDSVGVQFDLTATDWEDPYFHDDMTSTGYGESHLKKVIDKYYEDNIASTYSNYVLPVDLDLPNWARYSKNILFRQYDVNLSMAYNNWFWGDFQSWYTDNRFATRLTDLANDNDVINDVNGIKQQAFALSYGDIQTLDKSTFYDNNGGLQSDTGYYSTLLDLTAVDANYPYFGLRSAGDYSCRAGGVLSGYIIGHVAVAADDVPVRPALAIQLS